MFPYIFMWWLWKFLESLKSSDEIFSCQWYNVAVHKNNIHSELENSLQFDDCPHVIDWFPWMIGIMKIKHNKIHNDQNMMYIKIDALAPGRCFSNLKLVINLQICMKDRLSISCDIVLGWSQYLTDDFSTLVQVMPWWYQATSYYQTSSMTPYIITRLQWWNMLGSQNFCDPFHKGLLSS